MGIEQELAGVDFHLNDEYRRGFLRQVQDAMDGKAVIIPNQLKRLRSIFNLMQSRFILLGSSSGSGKLQPLKSKVLTEEGWTTIRELKIGDTVLCPRTGVNVPVLNLVYHKSVSIYKISFSDGTSAECCNDHLWEVSVLFKYRPDKSKRNIVKTIRKTRIIDVNYMLKYGVKKVNNSRKYRVDNTVPVEFKERDVEIHPYLLGALIGDGYLPLKNAICITVNSDRMESIFNAYNAILPKDVTVVKGNAYSNTKSQQIRFNRKIAGPLTKLGLLGKKSREKFVPKDYMYNSVAKRKELLAGLMDTDGSVFIIEGTRRKVTYSTMSDELKDNVIELVMSLGGTAYASYESREKYKGGRCWKISIRLNFNPFQLAYKRDKYNLVESHYSLSKHIDSIEYLREDEGKCLVIGSKAQMYITDSYIPTHNSSFIDDVFILKPWMKLKQSNSSIHFEVIYYSMERKKMFKHAKWLSWMLYQDKGWLIPADDIMGWNPDGPITKEVYDTIRSYDSIMSDLLDDVHIYDGRVSASDIARQIREKAHQLGVLFVADELGVKKWGVDDYLDYFTEDKIRMTRKGPVKYCEFIYKGESHQIEQNKKEYFLHNNQTFLFIVLDGVGLIQANDGKSTKQAVDEVTDLLADARDIYGFSPIMVSQFNRGLADSTRQKSHGADLTPQEADFKDSGNLFQAADLVLALFDPVRLKAVNKKGQYYGYEVINGMKSPKGAYRFRSLHVLKNSFGIDNVTAGLEFWGEVNHFDVLPPPESEEIQHIYQRILTT